MRQKNVFKSVSALMVALGMAASVASSHAQSNGTSGVVCNPLTSADSSKLAYSTYGVENTAASTASVMCAITFSSSDVDYMAANVYDRNSTTDVCCTFYALDSDGDPIESGNDCSSGNSASSQVVQWVLSGTDTTEYVAMDCAIPAVTASGKSHVTNFHVN